MPTTNLDIIKRAMKKLHVLPARTEPDDARAFDGMALLKSLYVELIGSGSLGRLCDVLATSNYTAYEFDRVTAAGFTITLPTTITQERCYPGQVDGPTDYGWGNLVSTTPRKPLDRAVIVVIGASSTTYNVWSIYKSAWVDVLTLGLQDEFPFAPYLEDGFAALLAERWVDDWDQALGAETKRQADVCRDMLAAARDSYHHSDVGQYF
jgi:hypothetical protein